MVTWHHGFSGAQSICQPSWHKEICSFSLFITRSLRNPGTRSSTSPTSRSLQLADILRTLSCALFKQTRYFSCIFTLEHRVSHLDTSRLQSHAEPCRASMILCVIFWLCMSMRSCKRSVSSFGLDMLGHLNSSKAHKVTIEQQTDMLSPWQAHVRCLRCIAARVQADTFPSHVPWQGRHQSLGHPFPGL